jgi:hypothetical protein
VTGSDGIVEIHLEVPGTAPVIKMTFLLNISLIRLDFITLLGDRNAAKPGLYLSYS